jgi:predicted dehydrogenase
MPDKLRLAIVGPAHPHGFGWRGSLDHEPDIEVVSLATAADGETGSLQEPYTRLPVFRHTDDLLTGPAFDAALVCLPNTESVDVCCRLAMAGKHLLLEKPVSADAQGMREVAAVMDRAGVVGQVAYQWRFHPGSRQIRALVEQGVLGRLYSMETRMLASSVVSRGPENYLFKKAVSGGGFFNWLGCHWLDLMNYLAGEHPTAVTAHVATQTPAAIDVEDMGVTILEYPSGLVASLHAGYVWGGGKDLFVGLRGEQGRVHWDASEDRFQAVSNAIQWRHMPDRTFPFQVDKSYGYSGEVTGALIADWLDAIRDRRPTHSSPANNVRVLETIDAIYASSETGRRVSL